MYPLEKDYPKIVLGPLCIWVTTNLTREHGHGMKWSYVLDWPEYNHSREHLAFDLVWENLANKRCL